MNRLIPWSISSNFNFSSLFINCKFRHIISIFLRLVLSRIILSILLRELLLLLNRIRLLVVLLSWYLTTILISNDSIRHSWSFRFYFRYIIIIYFLVRLFNKLSSSIRRLINYSWVFNLLLRYIDLLYFLNIAWIVIIITNIGLWINLLSKSKEITLRLNLILLYLLNRLNFLNRLLVKLVNFIIPFNIYTLLSNIIFSTLTIFIDKSLNIPS